MIVMWILLSFILVPIAFIGILHLWILRRYYKNRNYWPSKGVVPFSLKPGLIRLIKSMLKPTPVIETDTMLRKECKENNVKFIGGHEFYTTPFLYLNDAELLKQIMIKDFNHFVNRRKIPFERTNPILSKFLFSMQGKEWKELRSKMTPTFTTGKIKKMFKILDFSSKQLVKLLERESVRSSDVDFAAAYGKYTLDVIATAAFGIDGNLFKEENPVFEQMGQKIGFKLNFTAVMKVLGTWLFPSIMKRLGITLLNTEAQDFFTNVVKNVMKERETQGIKHDDFLQLMMELKKGKLEKIDESELDTFEREAMLNTENTEKVKEKFELDDDTIVAQSLLFIMAGFETTQSVLLFAAYQLALSPELQEKLAEEVISVFRDGNGEFTYESIHGMQYLDKFICETLRMYTPTPRGDRACNVPYTLPGTNITIEKGTAIAIPIYAMHHDEDIFPEPEKFDPERFSAENKAKRHPYAFMPFGFGPRNCIGMRFALTEVKVALAHFVLNCIVEPCEKTLIPMKFGNAGVLKPLGGSMWLKMKKRESYQ